MALQRSTSGASLPPLTSGPIMTTTPPATYVEIQTPLAAPASRAFDDHDVQYSLPVDTTQFDRATAIQTWSMARPHMRIFHISWLSALPGFLGWYAIPPLMPVIKDSLALSKGDVLNSDIASTASTILSRIVSGPLLELYGAQRVQSFVLWLGAIPIALAAFVDSASSLIATRFFVGLVGCVFVSSQFWTTVTFAKNVVGTSNAITGGLGLSGIGYAFLLLPLIHTLLASSSAISEELAWRITLALPAVAMVIMGTVAWYGADGCPMGEFDNLRRAQAAHSSTGTDSMRPGLVQVLRDLAKAFAVVLSDANTYILILHYGVCFGAELQLNNMGALYFYEEFTSSHCATTVSCPAVSKSQAALVASSFGLMNMFARALGGLASDSANRKYGMRGRQYVQFGLLCLEGVALIVLSRMQSLGPSIAVYVLVAIATQATGGSTFGIVPYVHEAYVGTVTGLVGAGGNLGGVVFGIIFRLTTSRADGLLYMGIIALASSVFTSCLFLGSDKHRLHR